MSETHPLATVKAKLSEFIDRVDRQHERVTITRHGRPAAVLISPDDLEGLEETLAILSDPELMDHIRRGDAELDAGEGIALEQLRAEHAARAPDAQSGR